MTQRESANITSMARLAAVTRNIAYVMEDDIAVCGPRLSGLRILAAEDVEINRLILEDMLIREGAHVVLAQDGRQAVNLVEEHGSATFDVVLMDIQMPVMDGFEATWHIHALAPSLPVIGLSAHPLLEEYDHCLAVGMVEHITKPVDLDILVSTIVKQACVAAGTNNIVADLTAGTAIGNVGRPARLSDGGSMAIDWIALSARYDGRMLFIDRLIDILLRSHGETPSRLRQAANTRDFETIRFVAHTLKGVAGNIEAAGLREIASHVEEISRAGQDSAPALAEKLAGAMEEILARLNAHARQRRQESVRANA